MLPVGRVTSIFDRPAPSMNPKTIHVLYEDNHLLVVDKPVGIATMGVSPEEPSMARLAAAYLKEKFHKPGNVYVGVVSRLDRLVSGILVLARTSKAASRLSAQLREQRVDKRYLTVVAGTLATEPLRWHELDHFMLKNESRQRMEVVSGSRSGAQHAKLRYRLVMQDRRCSLVEIVLITGRKHQIRLQLAEAGHPILGDAKYGSQLTFPHGIALHCHHVQVEHPTLHSQLEFSSIPKHWPANIAKLIPAVLPPMT